MDVIKLVRYNHHLWRRFTDFYGKELTPEQLKENHETSHHNIADVTMHAINMEDWWLHYVVPGKEWDGPAYDGFTEAAAMAARAEAVAKKTEAWLATLKPEDLTKTIEVDAGGGAFKTTLEAILYECVNEATHHRGEVLAMCWRLDKAAPYEGFLDFDG